MDVRHMRYTSFRSIYLAFIFALIVTFLGINFTGILKAHVNLEMALYILTINSLAVMAFFYIGNSENFKNNDLGSLKRAYKKEAPWHFVFAIITTLSIYILQYVINFNIYCPTGAGACVLASAQNNIFTWLAVTGLVFGGVTVSFILISISFILVIYAPISFILKKEEKIEPLVE